MDSITHIVTGALIGEVTAKRTLGKHAMLLGTVGQSLPDIDFLAAFWSNPVDNLLAHRGFTHSLLFMVVASFVCALIAERWHRKHDITLVQWFLFFSLQMSVHLLIDVMNVYGVGLFEPFSNKRISFNILFVADPLFSLWPAIAFIVLLSLRNSHRSRARWIRFGLLGCAVYFLLAFFTKLFIDSQVKANFAAQNIRHSRYFTTPTPLNILLWYVVAESKDGYFIGYRSILDKAPIQFTLFTRNDSLLSPLHDHEEVQHLKRFAQDYYIVSERKDTLIFSDIRFGQVFGWNNPKAPFVFQYYLEYPAANKLVVQRGRFASWNTDNIKGTFKRIRGF